MEMKILISNDGVEDLLFIFLLVETPSEAVSYIQSWTKEDSKEGSGA